MTADYSSPSVLELALLIRLLDYAGYFRRGYRWSVDDRLTIGGGRGLAGGSANAN